MRWRFMLDRALPLFTRDNRPGKSCARSLAKLKPSCLGWFGS